MPDVIVGTTEEVSQLYCLSRGNTATLQVTFKPSDTVLKETIKNLKQGISITGASWVKWFYLNVLRFFPFMLGEKHVEKVLLTITQSTDPYYCKKIAQLKSTQNKSEITPKESLCFKTIFLLSFTY